MGLNPDKYEGYLLDWLASTMAVSSFEVLVASRALHSDMKDIIERLTQFSIIRKYPTAQTSERVPVM